MVFLTAIRVCQTSGPPDRGATIFIGHSDRDSWRDRVFGDPVLRLIRAAEGIDVRVFPTNHAYARICGHITRELGVYLGYAAGVGKTFQMLADFIGMSSSPSE